MAYILRLIADAIMIGAYIIEKIMLTISYIKNYRKNPRSKVVAAKITELLSAAAKDSGIERIKGDTVIAEYDSDNDEIVQTSVAEAIDGKVSNLLSNNNGVVIIED